MTGSAVSTRVSTGSAGLDEVLCGGLPVRRMYLLQGGPGVGKTTLSLQFLLEGLRRGECCLYVTLSETKAELLAVAASHGWDLSGIHIYEMYAGEALDEDADEDNTLYMPAEVELGERMKALLAEVDRVKPSRVVLDSSSELRLLAQSPLRFRRQLLALKQRLVRRDCTVYLLESSITPSDPMIHSLVHGVITIEQLSPLYGAERRRMRVVKLREVAFRGGYHDMTIEQDGVQVFPRLVAAEHRTTHPGGSFTSGVSELDAMIGGGLDQGTSTLLLGPSGSGKSAIASQYAVTTAARGEKVAMFAFDEGSDTLLRRSASLGMDIASHVEAGRILLQQVDPAELAPGQFSATVRRMVEHEGVRLVVIDSLNGYLHAMPEEQFLSAHLHELLSYLNQIGVVTILVMAQQGLLGSMEAPIDVSYLADTVVLTRYFEAKGRVRKAISVLKRRSGVHEDTIREIMFDKRGLRAGPPLSDFHGVLTGVPVLGIRDSEALLSQDA
ncbi:MAG: ATPase domain-containing protein [Polyangiales bacterium]